MDRYPLYTIEITLNPGSVWEPGSAWKGYFVGYPGPDEVLQAIELTKKAKYPYANQRRLALYAVYESFKGLVTQFGCPSKPEHEMPERLSCVHLGTSVGVIQANRRPDALPTGDFK